MIRRYTAKRGVRNLERELSKLARKAVKELMISKKKSVKVDREVAREFLAVPKFAMARSRASLRWHCHRSGVDRCRWRSCSPSKASCARKGKMTVTGNLRDVMKESIFGGGILVRSRASASGSSRRCSTGATSTSTCPRGRPRRTDRQPVLRWHCDCFDHDRHSGPARCRMTGEITLRGRVLPIGGLKEKLLAAARGGIKTC